MMHGRPRSTSSFIALAMALVGCAAADPGAESGSDAASGTGGSGSGGVTGAGGTSSTGGGGGSAGVGGTSGGGGTAQVDGGGTAQVDGGGATQVDGGGTGAEVAPGGERFSFFYTSLEAMRRLSGSQNGFGGDLRYGTSNGLSGADKICQTIAEGVGGGGKTWRAFLSAVMGPDGQQVNAIDRVGEGPWYDRTGRLVAQNKAGLLSERPAGDSQTVSDLPDESGLGTKRMGDTHDVITGSGKTGQLKSPGVIANTCEDWTSTTARGVVVVGHAWPAGSGRHWIEAHNERSCAAGVNLVQNGPGNGSSIGAGGGWGGYYCFALTP
jgi:hypothetical protein